MSEFTTKDSGVREEYATGMRRDTEKGKPRFDLMFPVEVAYEDQFLTRFAELLSRGAEKYGDRNWESGFDEKALARAKSSAMRHMVQWLTGEGDEDHAAAVVFNLMQAEYLALMQPVRKLSETAEQYAERMDHGDLARSVRRALANTPLTTQNLTDMPPGSKVKGVVLRGDPSVPCEAGDELTLTKVPTGHWDSNPDSPMDGGWWTPEGLFRGFKNLRVIA